MAVDILCLKSLLVTKRYEEKEEVWFLAGDILNREGKGNAENFVFVLSCLNEVLLCKVDVMNSL